MAPHPFSRYRLRLFHDFVRILVIPSVTFAAIVQWSPVRLGFFIVPAYFATLILAGILRNVYHKYRLEHDAYRLGGRLPTEVKGKWPGNLDVAIRLAKAARTKYVGEFYLELFEEYRCTTLNLKLFWNDMHIKFVLSTGFNHFWRGRKQKERFESFLGNGIFNRDDEEWKRHRALARPFFAKDRTSDFELFDKYTQSTLAVASQLSAAGVPIEVQDLFSRFSVDSAAEFLFGEHLDTLHGELPQADRARMSLKGSATGDNFGAFVNSFEACQQLTTQRARRGYFWPVHELFKDEMVPHADVISRFLEPIVDRALANRNSMKRAGIKTNTEQNTFLEYLADNTEVFNLDPKVIQDQLLNILLAGRDTTACLLTFTTYFMAMHPEVARRMRAEVLEHCGRTGRPTAEHIKSLRYVHAVINETLRLFPPVPFNIRESRENGVLLPNADPTFADADDRPLYFPPETVVMYFSMLTQRNGKLWGADADAFDPDRWLDERLARFTENPMMYTPFSGGPRINYARNEATFFLVRLLQEFDTFTLAPDVQPEGSLPPVQWKEGRGRQAVEQIWPAYAMTLFVKGGLWVRLGRAQDGQ
ncbi:hypothetical protein EIP86_002605 [Pleurotus ostreatoroseus]|nr:hypothetical protein EIP86_002605 [Pleurotus ostreatoroseus]